MRPVTIDYIAAGTEGRIWARAEGGKYETVDNVAIDNRNVRENGLFFAIIGERVDAHRFLPDVVERGCHTVVVSDREWADKMKEAGDVNVILVDDTTRAIMRLAKKYMEDWPELRRVAVTGSVGKTSTKEFVYSVLSSRYRTGKTPGNLNSEYGIPLTVFGLDPDTEIAVIEIGLGYGADMEDLVDMVKPEAAIVTTIGSAHMRVFGTREKLAEAKLAITTGFGRNGQKGVLVVNSDCRELEPEWIRQHTKGDFDIVTIGTGNRCDYRISGICDEGIDGVKCTLEFGAREGRKTGGRLEMKLPVIGAHNSWNAALAVALGARLGISEEDGIEALKNVYSNDNRLDVSETQKYTVINDTYNASPESMKATLDILSRSKRKGRSVAVFGDMLELGADSAALHRSVGEYSLETGLDVLVTVGELAADIADGAREKSEGGKKAPAIISYENRADAEKDLPSRLQDGDLVIVKASRGMALEELVKVLVEEGDR